MTRSIFTAAASAVVILTFCLASVAWAVPGSLPYQGYLTDDSGSPIDGDVFVTFSIYTTDFGGTFVWTGTESIMVDQGLFSVELGGPANPFPPGMFDTALWLGVAVDLDPEMLPRRPLTTVAFSFKTDDAMSLQGQAPSVFDQSGHVADTGNPHGVTAGQTGAVSGGTFASHAGDAAAHHAKTTTFGELGGQAADSQIPAGVARDAELTWANLGGIPAGFADYVDDDSGGDITAVAAGTGLAGGGTAGDVTLALQVPLALSGSTTDSILSASNLSDGYGISGSSLNSYGVYGGSINSTGVYGFSSGGSGVYGWSQHGAGVFGTSITGHAGYFDGSARVTDDLLIDSGNLGIGVDDPNRRVYVVNRMPGLDYALKLDNPQVGIGSTGVGILFSTEGDGGALAPLRGKGGLAYVSTGSWNRGAFHFLQDDATGTSTPAIEDSVMTIANDGKIGIGMPNPNRRLYVVDPEPGLPFALKLDNPSIGTNGVGILFSVDGNGAGSVEPTRGKGGLAYMKTGSWNRGAFHFLQDSGANPDNPDVADAVVTIANDGNVGIGVTQPQVRLEVAGDVHVGGDLSWQARTHYLAIPPSAFTPTEDVLYQKSQNFLENYDETYSHSFVAPVQLPDNATIQRMTAFWEDQSPIDTYMGLRRVLFDSNGMWEIATAHTSWQDVSAGQVRSSYDDTIDSPVIDNFTNHYSLFVILPARDSDDPLQVHGVRIEYTTTGN